MAMDMIKTNQLQFCVILMLFCLAPKLVFLQIVSVSDISIPSVQCPSGFTCVFGSRNVTVEWGYNGHLCSGQTPGECYNGEIDPRGFQRGPMQKPVIIYNGDRLFFKTMQNLAIKPFNVTRSVFYTCSAFATENAVIPARTSSPFEIPNKYVDTNGVKYFIAETDNLAFHCLFGMRIEVFVHSTSVCMNPGQGNAICSSKGACAVTNKFFAYNQSCVCGAGYSGQYCEELNSCFSSLNPCRNGATCVDKASGLANDYECRCMVGFTGKNCETNINDCDPMPCNNNSVCVDGIASYTCLCPPGYNGKNCSKLVTNACEPSPCQNGGTCSLDENRHNYTCKCPAPFAGRNCSVNSTSVSSSVPVVISTSIVQPSTAVLSTSPMQSTPLRSSITSSTVTSSRSPLSTVSIQSSTSSKIGQSSSAPDVSTVLSPSHTSDVKTVMPSSTDIKTVQATSPLASPSSHTMATTSYSLVSSPTPKTHTSVPQSSTSTTHIVINATSALPTSSTIKFATSAKVATTSVMPTASSVVISRQTTVSTLPVTQATTTTTPTTQSPSVTASPTTSVVMATSTAIQTTAPPKTSQSTSVAASHTTSVVMATTIAVPTTIAPKTSQSPSPTTVVMATSTVIPTTVPPKTSQSPSVAPSPATSVVMATTTVVPTTIPPITKPLLERTCKDNPCNSGVCLDEPDSLGFNFTCQCPKPTYGPRCSADYKLHFPRFGNNSYLVHKPIALAKGFNKIVITFKTTAPDGLLFYSTHSSFRDFMQLYITNGNLEYRFDPGDSLVAIRSTVKVNTGKIVTAVVTYNSNNREGTLQVDSNPIQRNKARGTTVGIDLYNNWYIGGLPPGKSFGVNDNAKTTPTLHGCIRDIELNGDDIGFTEATDWNNLNECDKPCNHHPCHNGGNCTNDHNDPHEYQCKCPVGYEGKNCKKYTVCSGDPCKGGLCIADTAKDSKTCLCPYGRAGISCETDLNITVPCLSMVSNYSSYIQYQVPTKSGPYFAIMLQFKLDTARAAQDSLLVYSGQDQYQGKGDDFVALGISNNRVVFQYELGSGIARITSDVLDSKLEWHSVTAGRNGQEGYLYVDSQPSKRGSSPGSLMGLNLYSPLYLGGVPEISELPSNVDFRNGFHGCISNMAVRFGEAEQPIKLLTAQTGSGGWPVVTGRNVGDKNYSSCQNSNPCQNNGTCEAQGASVSCKCQDGWHGMFCASRSIPCINSNPCDSKSTCREVNNKAVCDCPLGRAGLTCAQIISIQTPKFNENSYMAFNPKNTSGQLIYIRATTNIKITFKPTGASGLLFYVTHQISSQRGDFLSISLHNGIIHYRYGLGSGVANLQIPNAISLNTEHTIEVTRSSKAGTLKLNNDPVISGTSPGAAIALDVESDFYLGGVPQLSSVNPNAVIDSSSLKDYVGCISLVQINNVKLPLTERGAKEGRNIDNCPISNPVVT